jgi:hypothetical protein
MGSVKDRGANLSQHIRERFGFAAPPRDRIVRPSAGIVIRDVQPRLLKVSYGFSAGTKIRVQRTIRASLILRPRIPAAGIPDRKSTGKLRGGLVCLLVGRLHFE